MRAVKVRIDPDRLGDGVTILERRLPDGRALRIAAWIGAEDVSLKEAGRNLKAMYRERLQGGWREVS